MPQTSTRACSAGSFPRSKAFRSRIGTLKPAADQEALLKRPAERPPAQCGTNAFVCSFEVDDFDRKSAKILSLGGVVALHKFCVPGKCWQGYFIDTEGNTFGIFEVDEEAGR